MPHIVVKMWPGRNDEIKKDLSEVLAEATAENLGIDINAVTVAVEEVAKEDWDEKVNKVEIENNPNVYFNKNGR